MGLGLRIKFHGTRHGDIDVDTYRGVRRERQRDRERTLFGLPERRVGFYCDSNLGAHTQKDKEKQQRIESDIQWGLKDPESGEVAQARGRPALEEVGVIFLFQR